MIWYIAILEEKHVTHGVLTLNDLVQKLITPPYKLFETYSKLEKEITCGDDSNMIFLKFSNVFNCMKGK